MLMFFPFSIYFISHSQFNFDIFTKNYYIIFYQPNQRNNPDSIFYCTKTFISFTQIDKYCPLRFQYCLSLPNFNFQEVIIETVADFYELYFAKLFTKKTTNNIIIE